jgi:hypothetical protein
MLDWGSRQAYRPSMVKYIFLLVTATALILPSTLSAQSAGTYQLLAAGTSGQEKGYCSVGTVVIRSNRTITITTKSPLESRATTYTGTISSKSFTASAGRRKLSGTISYAGPKHAYGAYTAHRGSSRVGAGSFSLTRK